MKPTFLHVVMSASLMGMAFAQNPDAIQQLRQMDRNGDGIISREEFTHFQLVHGGGAPNVNPAQPGATPINPTNQAVPFDGTFQTLDTNGDGILSSEEIARMPSVIGTRPSPTPTGPNPPVPSSSNPSAPAPANPTMPGVSSPIQPPRSVNGLVPPRPAEPLRPSAR